jgi:Methyltransferase domain
MRLAETLINQFYQVNPYQDFDHTQFNYNLQGWGSDHPIFKQIIDALQPKLIIEVGTWKGASAIHLASLLKEKEIDGAIICVDTWLGGIENLIMNDPQIKIEQFRKHGYPNLYYQFLANVIYQQMQDYIVPLPNTSTIAARFLGLNKIQADLVYIDGSHDEEDVYQDIVHYWQLLKPNGVMLGDDWNAGQFWYGVICAVNRFVKENKLNLQVVDSKWFMQKS